MKIVRSGSLQTHLGLAFLVLLLLPTSFVAWLAYDHLIELTKSERIKTVGRVADARHEQLTMVFRGATDRAESLLVDMKRRCGGLVRDSDCIRRSLDSFVRSEGALGAVLGGAGVDDVRVGASDVSTGDIPTFKPGQLARFSPRVAGRHRDYLIVAGQPREQLRLAVTYPVEAIQPVFVSHPDLGNSGETFLADAEGFFITSARYPSDQGHQDPIAAIPMRRCLSPESAETLGLDYRDVPIIHGFRFTPEIGGGCIMAHVDQAEALAPLKAIRNTVLLALLLFGALALAAALFFARRISRPIRRLTQVTRAIAAGDFSLRAVPAGNDEAADLANAFNAMTDRLVEINASLEQRVAARTESLRLMSSVFQNSGEGICITDGDNNIIASNRAFTELTGYGEDEVRGRNPRLLASGMTPRETYGQMWQALTGSGYWQGEVWDRHKDGRVFPIWLAITSLRADDGRVVNFFASFNDVSQRKQAEAALREGDETLRSILDTTLDGYWRIDMQGTLLDVNPAYCRQSGYSREELLRMRIPDLEAVESPVETAAHIKRLTETGYELFHSRHRRKDGSVWQVEISTTYRALAGGQCFVFLRDITERMRAEEALRASEERWHFALEGAGDGAWDWNLDTGRIVFSRRYQEMLGYGDEPAWTCLDDWKEHVNPQEMQTAMASLEAYLDGKIPAYHVEYRMHCADGNWKWLLARGKVVSRAEDGRPLRLIGTHSDITERKQAEAALRASTERLNEAERIAHLGAWELNQASGRLTWSDEVFRIFEIEPNQFGTSYEAFLAAVHPDDRDTVNQVYQDSLKNKVSYEITHRLITRDGRTKWVHERGIPELDANGIVLRTRGMVQDITERREIEDQVRQLAFYDPLTRLPNRRLLLDRLTQAMAQSKRTGCHGAVLFLDLDNFKPLNDLHGHAAGDLLLIEAAGRLTTCVREMDTVARFGGDEFVVIIGELKADRAESIVEAGLIAEKIRSVLSQPYRLPLQHEGGNGPALEHQCAASIGVVVFFDHHASQDDILRWADAAMYQAKEAGRDSVRTFDPHSA